MVERLADIEARIANLGDLQDIMGAMRALAAVYASRAGWFCGSFSIARSARS